MREKKNKLLGQVKESLGEALDSVTEENAKDTAEKWIEVADVDGNGTISFEEFKDFFTKLKEGIDEDNLKEVFESIDTDGSGELDVEEFGQAILSTLNAAE